MESTPEINSKVDELIDKLVKLGRLSKEDVVHIVHDYSFSELVETYADYLREFVMENNPEDVQDELDACEKELNLYLKKHGEILIHEPGQWENDTGPEGWYAISNNDGIFAYACTLEKAKRIKGTA